MEKYIDSVIPPLTDLVLPARLGISNATEMVSSSRNRGKTPAAAAFSYGDAESIQKERIRREKMAENFSLLQSIVPNLLPKATRERIVTETIEFIRRLEEERGRLEQLKKSISLPESMAAKPKLSTCTNRSSLVNVTTAGGGVAFFGIQLAFRRRLVANVFRVFENHRTEILAANVSVDEQRQHLTLAITAMVGGYRDDETIEKIKREILII